MKADPYGNDQEFDAYMRLEYVKMALVALGLAALLAINWWLP